jgi:hypothetical protein
MLEVPHPAILNREQAVEATRKHFDAQLALLQDLTNYGSSLVVRAFESSPKQLAEIVVCGVLLKQIVAMVDAVEVLLSSGCGHAAHLPARTAFEASIYADWILQGDSELKATRYMVGNYRQEREWTSKAIHGTAEAATLASMLTPMGVDIHANRPNLAAQSVAKLAEVNRILSQPEFATVDLAFTNAKGRRKADLNWYELDGLNSIRQVAVAVGSQAEYDLLYSKGSQVTHTGSYKDHVRFVNGEVHFKPIRHLESNNFTLNFVASIAVRTYRKIVTRYRPGEFPALQKKYLNDWRAPFLNIASVTYPD